ncbi:unnamed protein product, partial [marine sediment metagenome]
GRLPGSVVIQESGEPGQNEAKILIRGRTTLGDNTEPLVVIDGIPGRSFSEIDPFDVASISVLKDAAAAIYGATAANGVINSDDKILLDKTDAPEIFYGIVFDATYKNWSISILAQGQGTYYRMDISDERRGEAGNYFQWHFDNRWTPTNTDTEVARAYNRRDQYWAFEVNSSTYNYDNMAYCRLKNAVLTYNLPSTIFGNSGISRASVYFSGNNLFLIYAAQKNFDPEIGAPMTYPGYKNICHWSYSYVLII